MRSWPATKTASYVDFLLSPRPPLTRRDDASGPTALPRECHFCRSQPQFMISRPRTATAAGAGSPVPLVSGIGKEPQRPGNQARVRTRFPDCPPAIHPRESPAAAGPAAIIRQAQKLSRLRCSHSPPPPRSSQQKTSPPLCRNCGRKLFFVETRGKLRTIQDHFSVSADRHRGRVPHVSPLLRDVGISCDATPHPTDISLHRHDRGCPTLRDFRRVVGYHGPRP
jgi:hypothetical protein